MSESISARFFLFMNAVDDALLEEALAVPARKRTAHWRILTSAAACLCAVVGIVLLLQSRTQVGGVTAADLAEYGYELPLPADARDVRYDLLPSPSAIPTAQVSWYSNQIQWSVRSDMTPADLLDTVDSIFSALGYQLSNAPEGARDVHYNAFHLDDLAVGETTFTLDGVNCAYRIAPTYDTRPDFADISGVEGDFARHDEAEIGWCPARLDWDDGGGGKVVWFDPVPGQLYSLSVDAGVSREGLLELAGQLFLPAQSEL